MNNLGHGIPIGTKDQMKNLEDMATKYIIFVGNPNILLGPSGREGGRTKIYKENQGAVKDSNIIYR